MEDKVMKNRLEQFMKISASNPLENREKYMISLRKKKKQEMFNK